MKVRESIELAAAAEEVFEVLLDVDRLAQWVTTHRSIVEEPDGPLAEGSTFRQKLRVAGLSFTVRWQVTRLERPRRIEWRGEGPGGSDARVNYALDGDGSATRFEYLNEFHLPGGKLGQLAGRAVGEARARRETRRSLERLKHLIED